MDHESLQKSCKTIRNYCRDKGYRGVIGIDFLHVVEEGVHKFYLMEINARLNGSTTGGIIGSVNNLPYWGVNNGIKTTRDAVGFIDAVEKQGLMFDPVTRVGVLPTNISAIADFKKAMIFASANSQQELNDVMAGIYNIG